MKKPLRAAAILFIATGLLWIGQGTGHVNWPSSSFMIRQVQWAYFGAALIAAGILMVWAEIRR